jgi:hypothetical protein
MEKIELKLDGVQNELTIREGEAQKLLPLKEPNVINVVGDIHSVSNFIAARQVGHSSQAIDKNKAIVLVNKNLRTIVLKLDPENYYGATITAKLEQSKELEQFGINTNTRYSRKSLLDLLRFNRLFFEDKNAHAKLLLGLTKLRIKSETEIEQEKGNQGNKRNLHDVKVVDDGGLEKEFNISVPIFKGFNPQNISVEICYELLNGDVSFWLESVGLKEVTESQIDGIFETQLKSAEGFVIINQ